LHGIADHGYRADIRDKVDDVIIFLEQGGPGCMHSIKEVIVHLGSAQTGGKLTLWTKINLPAGGSAALPSSIS
jgi:hypothetical protein